MKIEIFEEDGDNTLSFDDKYADFTIDVYPDSKTYQSRMRLLETDILADRQEVASMSSMTKEFIDGLKKEVEWHDDWTGNPVSVYILS